MLNYIQRIQRRRAEDGASAVEYGLLVAAIAALIVAVIFVLGSIVKGKFNETCNGIKTQGVDTSSADCT